MGRSSENNSVARLTEAFQEFSAVSEQLASSYALLEDSVGRLALQLTGERFRRRNDRDEKDQLTAHLEQVLDAMPAGLIVLDGDGVVQQCNAMAVEFLGSPLLGVLWRAVISRVFAAAAPGDVARLRDGRLILISTTPLGTEPGQIILLQDVTEQHTVQETLNRHQRHASMGEMAASLAHQVRTPLASSLLYVAKLERESESLSKQERARCIRNIKSSLNHIERTVAHMLAFSRGGTFKSEDIRVSALLTEVRNLLKVQARERHVELSVINRASRTVILGSREAMLGVIQNLVVNAFEALGEAETVSAPKVVVHASTHVASRGEKYLEIRVSDNGPGIPPDAAAHIFQPFYSTKGNGTGLGLAVAEAIVKAHGGALWLDTGTAVGVAFIVRLPVKPKGVQRRSR